MDKIFFAASAFMLLVSILICALLYSQLDKINQTTLASAGSAVNAGNNQSASGNLYYCAPSTQTGNNSPAETKINSVNIEDIYRHTNPETSGSGNTAKDYFISAATQAPVKTRPLPAYAHISNAGVSNSATGTMHGVAGNPAYGNSISGISNAGPDYRYASSPSALPPSPERKMVANQGTANTDCQSCGQISKVGSPTTTENDFPPATACTNVLKSKNDELYALLNPPPPPERYMHINPMYEYGKTKETPLPETGLAVRCSTEAMVSEIINYAHFPGTNPIAARPQKPDWNAQLNAEKGVWRFYINPYWKRTDFGVAFPDAPSSKWDKMGVLLGGAWSKGIYDVGVFLPLEHNSFGGQMSDYGFTRLGPILSSNFRIMRQCGGKPVDFSVGADLYGVGVIGDSKDYIDSYFQFGGGIYTSVGRDLGFMSTLATLQWQCNAADDYSALPTHLNTVSMRLEGGIPVGKSININPFFKYNTALSAPEYVETKYWMEYGLDFKFALSPTAVFTFNLGAEGTPLKTWHMGGGLDMIIKF